MQAGFLEGFKSMYSTLIAKADENVAFLKKKIFKHYRETT